MGVEINIPMAVFMGEAEQRMATNIASSTLICSYPDRLLQERPAELGRITNYDLLRALVALACSLSLFLSLSLSALTTVHTHTHGPARGSETLRAPGRGQEEPGGARRGQEGPGGARRGLKKGLQKALKRA